jgi:PmbA protein
VTREAPGGQPKELIELGRRAAARAIAAGAEAAEVLVSDGEELFVKVRMGEPELVQEAGSRALGLRVFRDRRAAVTYTSDLGPGALDRFVDETVELAALAEPDELNELPPADSYARELPELELFDERLPGVTAVEGLRLAIEGEAAARAYSPKITNSDGASYSRNHGSVALVVFARGGGAGAEERFAGGYGSTYHSLTVEPIADDRDGKKRNAHYWTGSRYLDRLEPAEAVGREAARRTVARLGAEKIETAVLPVVFDPDAGRALLRGLFSVIAGSAIYRRSSYLVGREGTLVASPLVTLVDDPLIARAPGSRPFDGEGLPARKNVVVDGGRLLTYLLDTYSARKLGRASNGCAGRGVGGSPHVTTSNLVLQAGASSKQAVLDVPRGLYVTEMMGFGFNAVTGDFSRGAGGFLIEDGKLGRPVTEVTVSANFDDLWKSVDAVGDDLELKTSTACPTFRVAKMTVAGR